MEFDGNANMFPDEVADLLNNDVDPDDDCRCSCRWKYESTMYVQ